MLVGQGVPFDRVRRITGYLTGNLNCWNSAKRAEERDRVKHQINTEHTSRLPSDTSEPLGSV